MSLIDKSFISKVLECEDLAEAYRFKVTNAYIDSAERPLWDFIEDFYRRYQSMPSKSSVKEQFEVELPEVKEPLEYWANEILNRELQEGLRELAISIDDKLMKTKPREAMDLIFDFMEQQKKLTVASIESAPIGYQAEAIEMRYEQSKLGLIGIPTPWISMDNATGGWSPGNIDVLAARNGVGKSWLTILVGLKAASLKKKVLFFTGEMTEDDIASRSFAIKYRIPYGKLRSGKLLPQDESRMKNHLQEFRKLEDIIVVNAYKGCTTNDVDLAIIEHKPDLVIVDAAYRLKAVNKVKDRLENMAYVTTELKTCAGKNKVPIVFSVQLNRGATNKKGKDLGTEDVAMTDVLGWEASNMFFLNSNEELRENRQMEILQIKVRENANLGKPILVHWDFDIMNFDEIDSFHINNSPRSKVSVPPGREDDGF